jgi:hypothetical protein
MPLTRAQGEAALRHVVRNVMNQPDNGLLERSLTNAKLIDVGLLGSLIESDIENLTYVAATEGEAPPQAPIPIRPGQRGILRAFLAYIRYRGTQPDPIGDGWLDITQVEFDLYRISPLFNGIIFGNPMPTTTGGSAASSAGAPRDPVADFKRGIKRDPSQFPTLKNRNSGTIGTVLTELKQEHKALSKSWTRPTFRPLQKTRHCSKSSKRICSPSSKRPL